MTIVHKSTTIKEVHDDRTATFVASDDSVDRYGDVIDAKGWDVKDFNKNPQFLFGHNSQSLPIGKVLKTWVSGNQFKAKVTFLPAGMDEFADKCFELLKGGFLNAVSVGFMPVKREPIYDDEGRYKGSHFLKQSLLELSLVPIPANSNAVQVARSFNLSTKDYDLLFAHDSVDKAVANSRTEIENLKLRLSI
ncbi:MAG: HK97 family phage prohead protease [Deltaproteobacteria bacterium]|nr:HK97 family phage prohead protease [Deltaproteobacteria bacterium]